MKQNRSRLYKLDRNLKPVPCKDVMEWGRWYGKSEERRVAKTMVGDLMVSTVFLGLDHQWGKGPPILWETMVFAKGSSMDLYMDRCSGSWEQAEAMHEKMVKKVRRGL